VLYLPTPLLTKEGRQDGKGRGNLMRIRGLWRLKRAGRWVRNRFVHKGVILVYHSVVECPTDPPLLRVTPRHFAEHLEVLTRSYQPMRLNQLGEALHSGSIPPGAVVLTFDDGYADNLHHAKPLLERFDVPATVFVTAGCLGRMREFCWDELDRLLLQPGILPATLRLNINGSNYQWELSEAVQYSEEDVGRFRGWSVLEKNDPGPRQRLYRALWKLLRPLREGDQRQVLDDLLAWSGAESIVRPTHRALSPAELLHLAEGELIEVGAHTVTHPILSQLSATEQRVEIQRGKTHLEEILGRPVTSFAYPFGGRSEYTAETVAIVRDTGFSVACSTVEDVVWRGSNGFQLPRISVQDWDGEVFSRWLWGWLRG